MSGYDRCTEKISDKMIVLKENKSTFTLINKNNEEVNKVRVDDCLIRGNNERCDWLLHVCYKNREHQVIFIELKGCLLDKAISQLSNTLRLTAKSFGGLNRQCHVVTTRVPKHGPSVRKRALVFFKKNKVPLYVKNIRAEVAA